MFFESQIPQGVDCRGKVKEGNMERRYDKRRNENRNAKGATNNKIREGGLPRRKSAGTEMLKKCFH